MRRRRLIDGMNRSHHRLEENGTAVPALFLIEEKRWTNSRP
jgi:hypothetical protein